MSLSPKVVLGIAAHPDDLDLAAGGTLARFAAGGAQVHYLQLTDGCKGTSDSHAKPNQVSATRDAEQQKACQTIGGKSVTRLKHCDGELAVTLELKGEIVKVIRDLKPDLVITTDPTLVYVAETGMINHTDHRAAGQAALDAVYPLARDPLSFPKQLKKGVTTHKVDTVLLINAERSNFYVDITDVLSTKLAAMKCHASQVTDITALSETLTDIAAKSGKLAGCQYAEGFVRIDVKPW